MGDYIDSPDNMYLHGVGRTNQCTKKLKALSGEYMHRRCGPHKSVHKKGQGSVGRIHASPVWAAQISAQKRPETQKSLALSHARPAYSQAFLSSDVASNLI